MCKHHVVIGQGERRSHGGLSNALVLHADAMDEKTAKLPNKVANALRIHPPKHQSSMQQQFPMEGCCPSTTRQRCCEAFGYGTTRTTRPPPKESHNATLQYQIQKHPTQRNCGRERTFLARIAANSRFYPVVVKHVNLMDPKSSSTAGGRDFGLPLLTSSMSRHKWSFGDWRTGMTAAMSSLPMKTGLPARSTQATEVELLRPYIHHSNDLTVVELGPAFDRRWSGWSMPS